MAEQRRYKLADVTAESRAGWLAFAERVGCTPTALVEVAGLHLADIDPDDPKLGIFDQAVIEEARRLTVERRKRIPPED